MCKRVHYSGNYPLCSPVSICYHAPQFDLVAVNELSYQQLFADNSSTLPLRVTLFGLYKSCQRLRKLNYGLLDS